MKKKDTTYPTLDGTSPWKLESTETVKFLESHSDEGLDSSQARSRLQKYGPNRIEAAKQRSIQQILTAQIKNLIVLLLAVAAGVSFILGQFLEGIAILVALIINVFIGFGTELRAARSMEALQQMTRRHAKVLRQSEIRKIDAAKLVPGDIVVLEGGDIVPADLRLIEANRIKADESALTGESVPVDKDVATLAEDTPLAERNNMLFNGTALTQGSGRGVVVATGMSTQLGHISQLAEGAQEEALTPLEKRLNSLGQKLIWITLGIALLIGVTGVLAGKDLVMIFKTSVALAVAAIPEGLPIVATIALARGMWRMAQKNALVNRLSAVETLGSTSIICADKTGTLTENKMTLSTLVLVDSQEVMHVRWDPEQAPPFSVEKDTKTDDSLNNHIKETLIIGMLCSNAHLPKDGEGVGDPMELALLQAGKTLGLQRDDLLEAYPEKKEEAFSPETKMMATWHTWNQDKMVAVKGAPEAVLESSSRLLTIEGQTRKLDKTLYEKLLQANETLADQGLRVLGIARRFTDAVQKDPYSSLTFMGFVGLLDPPRKNIRKVIDNLKQAGVRLVMVTGDHPGTASAIAQKLDLPGDGEAVIHGDILKSTQDYTSEERHNLLKSSVFARISPEQKLNLVALFQADGSVVAMTGDGVNDAPALTKADIGVAMGGRGTQVAREAADIVLKDDNFATIALAMEQGRVIFSNIRKFIVFLLSGNVGAILIVGLAMLFGSILPLLPLQILYLNMISDVFPALALGVGKGEPSVMDRPPRPSSEPVVTRALWMTIFGYGLLIAGTALTGFWISLEKMSLSGERAVTITFLILAFTRTWHVFNMRDAGSGVIVNDVTRNLFVWGAVVLSIVLLIFAVYFPPLSQVLTMVVPTPFQWLFILGMSLVPLVVVQIIKQMAPHKNSDTLLRKRYVQ
ncbi:cation-transporting P-type ATPase [uncultured Desulfobacter sp.]|uniref:cation-translocating P-type ATPase n=1 Tax=uncultured Desulfobacter sp. TaxID=240139 RepID=UPI0029C8ACB0|nr:cation-transporting P-type ATPase [uncultured Desulfobacter sp.]